MFPFDDVIMSLQYIIFFLISEFCLLETDATLLANNVLIFQHFIFGEAGQYYHACAAFLFAANQNYTNE